MADSLCRQLKGSHIDILRMTMHVQRLPSKSAGMSTFIQYMIMHFLLRFTPRPIINHRSINSLVPALVRKPPYAFAVMVAHGAQIQV